MAEGIARIRFSWDVEFTRCRATAYGVSDHVLGEVTVELPAETRRRIWATRGPTTQYRIEEVAEKHLRTMLDLRY
jgi:hypothetical protein